MRYFLVFFFGVALWGATGRADEFGFAFELADQYGTPHSIEYPAERIRVFALADREGSRQMESWVVPLHERYGETIEIHGVAKLKGVPSPIRPLVRRLFRRSLERPVMMDWTGAVSEAFDIRPHQVNLRVLRPDGQLVFRWNGAAHPAALEECFAQIDAAGGPSKPVPLM